MSDMTVAMLEEVIDRKQQRLFTNLEGIEVSDTGQTINVIDDEGGEHSFEFDEVVERSLSEFLGVNPTYMKKCPPSLKAHNLNYWLRENPHTLATIMAGPKGLESIHDTDSQVVTVPDIAGVISRVFKSDDKITELHSDATKFHADIIVDANVVVPGNGVGDRPDADGFLRRPGEDSEPMRVFDITHGGVRFLSHPSKPKAPVVERYFNRLICDNGLTMDVVDRRITLRGKTVDDVIAEMEDMAHLLLSDMDDHLQAYKDLADMEVPGNPLAFIRQVGKEQAIPDRIVNKALEYAGAINLGQEHQATAFDAMNVFNITANMNGVTYGTRRKLQATSGQFVMQGEEIVARCSACERSLLG